MIGNYLGALTPSEIILYSAFFLATFILIIVLFFMGAWTRRHASALSPYSGFPLRYGSDLPYESARKILQFLYDQHETYNPIFDIKRAAFCRETKRIFPNCISWFNNTIHLDWTFLQKRYPGNYVSWGSLSPDQQTHVLSFHGPLSGFQMEHSSKHATPQEAEPEYALSKPGPLYVDLEKNVLLGWKLVPDTEFEVLIVHKQKKTY